MNTEQLIEDLKNHDIIVMPGYVGIGEKDRPVLLGNGGADMTAIYVAQQLGVKALLLKDVDGVYEHDPRGSGPAPKRYSQISWDDAIERAGPLVASKAMQYAKDNSLEFDIGTIGMPIYTAVGPTTSDPKAGPVVKPMRVAMMGCGVVGGGVLRRVRSMPSRFSMVKIMVRNVDKYIAEGIAPELLTADFDDVLAAEPDVFIDVSGPIDPGLDFSRQMLSRGVHVVSANDVDGSDAAIRTALALILRLKTYLRIISSRKPMAKKPMRYSHLMMATFIKYAAKAQAVGRRQSLSWRILWIFPAKIFVSF